MICCSIQETFDILLFISSENEHHVMRIYQSKSRGTCGPDLCFSFRIDAKPIHQALPWKQRPCQEHDRADDLLDVIDRQDFAFDMQPRCHLGSYGCQQWSHGHFRKLDVAEASLFAHLRAYYSQQLDVEVHTKP